MKVDYFGEIAEITKKTSEDISLKEKSLLELVVYLSENYKICSEDIHIAVNHTIMPIDENVNLKETDEVAVLSPFAGG